MNERKGAGAGTDLGDLLDPARTAVVTMELQRAVVGDLATMGGLAKAAAETQTVANAARICRTARAAGARVVHCTAQFRADGAGSARNCKLLAIALDHNSEALTVGAPGAELVGELEASPADIVISRLHGLTPFTSTALDQVLRNCGITTVVATGVSLNVGVAGLVLSAVDLGYRVVVPDDAVVGLPVDYGRAVMRNTISLLATVTSTDAIVEAWSP